MPPKRAAPASSATTAPKKAKAAAASKASPKAAPKGKAAPKSTLETVGETLKSAGKKVAEVVDNAGDLLVDDVSPAAEKKGKKAAAPAAAASPAAARGTKRKAAAAKEENLGKKIAKAVDTAGSLLIDDIASAAASDAEAAAPAKKGKKAAATAPKGRKTADDFMDKAEKAVANVADKVGSALNNVVREFGEASGLIQKKEDAPKANKTATKTKAAKGKKAVEAEAQPEAAANDDDEGSEASFIGAFESDDEMGGADSSDDESDDEDAAVAAAAGRTDVQVAKLPKSKDDKEVAARLKKASKKKGVAVGTVFLGRIPHGFYEDAMKEYFGQFGDVTRLRLARNPNTGASRHYGYIEFSSLPVAEIVAETMNNYLLMGHLLRCEIVPAESVHPELWVGANKKFRKVPRARLEKVRNDKPRTQEQQERANANVLKRQEERRSKIKAAGIDYTFEGH